MGALDGKVVVIVGGTTGLGLSAGRACIDVGARVVLVGRNPDSAKSAESSLGPSAITVSGDASDPNTATVAISRAIDRFGRFDALYHVAGGSGRKAGDGPLHEITDAGWQFTLSLNLTSLFNSNRAAVRQFMAQKTPGSILNMGSVLGVSPSPRYFATHAYAATKAAALGLTRSCAAYYAPHNIRFNLLAPALVETPMSHRAMQDESILRFTRTKQPLDGGRVGLASDLDAAVVYFLSDASRFCTGQILYVDGGWCITEGQHGG